MLLSTREFDCRNSRIMLHFETEECLPCAAMRDRGTLDEAEKYMNVEVSDIMFSENTRELFERLEVEYVPTFIFADDCNVVGKTTGILLNVADVVGAVIDNMCETEQEVRDMLSYYASHRGLELTDKADRLIERLLKQKEKYGHMFCPCRTPPEEGEHIENNVCPCKWHMDEVREDGRCLCGMFKGDDV